MRALAEGCRFRDCTHSGEPGCAVEASGLDPDRLGNYRKMQRELDYLDRKTDKRLDERDAGALESDTQGDAELSEIAAYPAAE